MRLLIIFIALSVAVLEANAKCTVMDENEYREMIEDLMNQSPPVDADSIMRQRIQLCFTDCPDRPRDKLCVFKPTKTKKRK